MIDIQLLPRPSSRDDVVNVLPIIVEFPALMFPMTAIQMFRKDCLWYQCYILAFGLRHRATLMNLDPVDFPFHLQTIVTCPTHLNPP
jgi:hypothetical protein